MDANHVKPRSFREYIGQTLLARDAELQHLRKVVAENTCMYCENGFNKREIGDNADKCHKCKRCICTFSCYYKVYHAPDVCHIHNDWYMYEAKPYCYECKPLECDFLHDGKICGTKYSYGSCSYCTIKSAEEFTCRQCGGNFCNNCFDFKHDICYDYTHIAK
jgi:hypothetical protein